MTFLKEDSVLGQLLINSETLTQLLKLAQLTDPTHDLAVKLARNLRAQTNSASTNSSESEVFTRDLKSLDDLLNFLSFHNIVFNGLPVVDKIEAEKGLYEKYNNSFVYKDGFENFVKTLQKHAEESSDKLMEAMLGKIIIEANQKLHTNLQASTLNEKNIDDEEQLDSLPSTIDLDMDFNKLLSLKGDFKLLAKHLKDAAGFKILKEHFLLKKNGEVHNIEEHGDICIFINFLFNRAKVSGNSFYSNRVQQIAKDNGCEPFDYKNPYETTSGTTTNENVSYKTVNDKNVGGKGALETSTISQEESDVLSNLPFVSNGIDIRRMETFLEKITHFINIGGAISEANRNTVSQIVQSFHSLKDQWLQSLPSRIGGLYANGPSDFDPEDIEAQNKFMNDFGNYGAAINSSLILRAMVKNCLDTLSVIGRDARMKNVIGSLKEQLSLGNQYYNKLSNLIENAKTSAKAALR